MKHIWLGMAVWAAAVTGSAALGAALTAQVDLSRLQTPILFAGDARTAYRDPAVYFHDGTFYLYMTYGSDAADGRTFWQTAWSKSKDLVTWTAPRCFTPKDLAQNFSSPGDIVRDGDDFVLCLQTYPTPQAGQKYGDEHSRIWIRRSHDLENWGPPQLLRVQGPTVPPEKMGRIIDPYLLKDKDDPGKWWCLYKYQGKVCASWSRDLAGWTPAGAGPGGENPCVIVERGEYVLFHAPSNGIGVSRSADMKTWRNLGVLPLGQQEWPWARGRLTAGFVLDLRQDPQVGKALMFFHGSRYPEADPRGGWGRLVSIGLAWSDDLVHWDWPGKTERAQP